MLRVHLRTKDARFVDVQATNWEIDVFGVLHVGGPEGDKWFPLTGVLFWEWIE